MTLSKRLVAQVGAALVTCVVFAASSAPTAEAALMMRLTEGASSVTIVDGGAGDSNPVAGALTFIGSVGAFAINVSTGLSKPVLPASPSYAQMDLNSVNISTAPATLIIELTDTDFPAAPAGWLLGDVGGTSQGTTEFWAYKNSSNIAFDTANADASIALGPFLFGPFAGSASDSHGAIGVYSMTMIASITHGPGINTSTFDFQIQNVVAEPASLALLGIGLLGAGAISARRRKARS